VLVGLQPGDAYRPNSFEESGKLYGLFHVTARAACVALVDRFLRGRGSEDHDREQSRPVVCADAVQNLVAIHPRQIQVEENQTGLQSGVRKGPPDPRVDDRGMTRPKALLPVP
jgi:hypothetical protein